jgi:hypothetical protein
MLMLSVTKISDILLCRREVFYGGGKITLSSLDMIDDLCQPVDLIPGIVECQ